MASFISPLPTMRFWVPRNLGPIGLHNAHNEETSKIAQNITAHVQALNKLVIWKNIQAS
jgi:hypothetical protein